MRAFEAIKIGSDLLKKRNIQTHSLDSELLLSKTYNTNIYIKNSNVLD